jgi:tetratricopeptide (TPR) repeat protein
MSRKKLGAMVMSALLLVYIMLLANTGLNLLTTGLPVAQVMGFLILVFPLLGLWAMFVEFKFGIAAEKLIARIEAEGAWPDLGIETRPSGRAVRASADAAFAKWSAAAEQNPNDFRAWFNLSLAYDACGDRRRARSALRKAIALSNAS